MELTPKELGQRVAALRSLKGWTQQELADKIGFSRSAVTNLESGNRSLDVTELPKLAAELSVSYNDLLSKKFVVDQLTEKKEQKSVQEERISIPKMEVEKFKNVLLYILERCAGKPNVGETVLYKLLYFSDFNYYELYEEHLTGTKYRKLPYGPVPLKLDVVIGKMIEDGKLKKFKTDYHGKQQTRYIPLEKPDLRKLKASEIEVIDRVIDQMSDWTAKAISDYSHKDVPWLATKDSDFIDYELAFYREAPFSARQYFEDETEA